MGICNYCTLKSIEKRAPEGSKVCIIGNNIYVVPKGEKLNTGSPDDVNNSKQWVAWLMEIPDQCRC